MVPDDIRIRIIDTRGIYTRHATNTDCVRAKHALIITMVTVRKMACLSPTKNERPGHMRHICIGNLMLLTRVETI